MAEPPAAHGADEVAARLAGPLSRWSHEDGRIVRRYRTQGWKSAVILVATIGHLAEAAWHHPEVTASYGAVEVRLWSHDADGVTDRDLALAARIRRSSRGGPAMPADPSAARPMTRGSPTCCPTTSFSVST